MLRSEKSGCSCKAQYLFGIDNDRWYSRHSIIDVIVQNHLLPNTCGRLKRNDRELIILCKSLPPEIMRKAYWNWLKWFKIHSSVVIDIGNEFITRASFSFTVDNFYIVIFLTLTVTCWPSGTSCFEKLLLKSRKIFANYSLLNLWICEGKHCE